MFQASLKQYVLNDMPKASCSNFLFESPKIYFKKSPKRITEMEYMLYRKFHSGCSTKMFYVSDWWSSLEHNAGVPSQSGT